MEFRSTNRHFSISPNGLLTVPYRNLEPAFVVTFVAQIVPDQNWTFLSPQRETDAHTVMLSVLWQFSFPSQKFCRLVSVHFFSSWVSVKTCPLESTPPRPA